jgi:hypothetical protein
LQSIAYSDATPTISYLYDLRGHPTNITQGASAATSLTSTVAVEWLTESYTNGPLSGFSVVAQYHSLGWRTNLALRNAQGAPLVSVASTYDPAGRLKTVSDGTNTATCTYLASSPLIGYIAFTQNSSNRMTTTRQYDPVR